MCVLPPDPFRRNRPHEQRGGTDLSGFRNEAPGVVGHRPRKDLGQHFLTDLRVIDDIMAAAQLKPGERVLEIGPGPGVLTRPLANAVRPPANAKSGGTVVAIEADRHLAAAMQAEQIPGVEVVVGDAVQTDLARVGVTSRADAGDASEGSGAPRAFDAIVANLPYLISGPITAAFIDLLADPATRWKRAVLMFQREFALRLLASPSTPDYGRLTVHAARACRITKVREVPPGAFAPPPRVDSMVVLMTPHAAPPFAVADEVLFRAVVDGTFQRRRKQLRNGLPAAVGGVGIPHDVAVDALLARGWEQRRPENLTPAEFALLANDLAGLRKTPPSDQSGGPVRQDASEE